MAVEPRSLGCGEIDVAVTERVGRTDTCPCGSGRKYKLCCGANSAVTTSRRETRPQQKIGPPSAEASVQLAGRLTKAGDLRGAVNALERATLLQPKHPAAHYNLALASLNAGLTDRATAGFRRAVALSPNFAEAHFQLGIALGRLGDDLAAIEALQSAVRISPKMAEAHHCLGRMFRVRGKQAEAIQAYKRAAGAAPNTTLGRLSDAWAMILEQRGNEAEECLRRAMALDPANSELPWLLATLLGEAGRFDEAELLFQRTIDLDPGQVGAYYDLLTSKQLTESDRPLLTRMKGLVGRPNVVGEPRIRLLFALAKGLDDLREYDEAMRCFDEANRLCRQALAFDHAEHKGKVDRIIEAFTADYLASNASLGTDDARPIMILGMPRSGTTLVEQIVSSHPSVSAGGEIQFWIDQGDMLLKQGLAEGVTDNAGRLASAYRAELDRISSEAARITDKNPYNFFWIGLVRLAFPKARIIHCRRHAVDTCLSIYTTHFAVRTGYGSDRRDLVFYYRQYRRLMRHWNSVLPPGTMFDVQYEDLIADPERWSRALIDFCELDWHPACLRPEKNRRSVKTASLWQARQPIYRTSVDRWRNYEPWLGELRELLDESS
jgi:tetratricopeptide (TPR) repeat protein